MISISTGAAVLTALCAEVGWAPPCVYIPPREPGACIFIAGKEDWLRWSSELGCREIRVVEAREKKKMPECLYGGDHAFRLMPVPCPEGRIGCAVLHQETRCAICGAKEKK